MSTRTFEELNDAVNRASSLSDAASLMECADELDAMTTPQAVAVANRSRGWAHFLCGDYTAALEHLRRALAMFEDLGDRSGLAGVTNSIGSVHNSTGDRAAALEHYQRALAMNEDLGDRSGVADVSGNIGIVHQSTGNYSTALEHYQRSLTIYEELGDRSGVARVSNNIGNVHNNTGNYAAALECFHCALAAYEELGSRDGVALVAGNIGIVHGRTSIYPAALKQFHRALTMYQELGNRGGVARVTGNIGNVYVSTGDYSAALEHFHRALVMHQELDERNSVAIDTASIGNVHCSMVNYPAALEHYHRALAIFEELGNRSGVATITSNIGMVHMKTGNYPAALEHYRRALAAHEELGEINGVARVTCNILAALIESGEHAEALLLKMDEMQIDDPNVVVDREKSRADLQQNTGNTDEAVATLLAALQIAREHALASQQATLHKTLRDLALKRNDLTGYVEHNNEFTRITEEINGKEATLKIAMQEKQREIDAREREVQKQLAVLHSTIPKHIADRVARGATVNDHHENAAVIFLDIVGFTSISDRIPSGHVVHLLEQIFTTLDAVCEKHNVVKIKTIGDSYMAVSFDSVVNAAACAREMLSSLDALEITMPPSLGDTSWTKDVGDIKVRIGVHCGPVTAGVIGTQRMQYDVWGDTVNVASRMESTSEPGRIHISEAFAHAVQQTTTDAPFSIVERGSVEIKGKGAMKTYWLE